MTISANFLLSLGLGSMPNTRLEFVPHIVERLVASSVPILLTGGGGWIGQAALEMLDGVFGDALQSVVTVFGATAKPIELRSGRRISSRPLTEMSLYKGPPAFVLHCAFITRGHVATMALDDYVRSNRLISHTIQSMIERCGARGVFLPSSGAVYRPDRTIDADLGRNPYGVLKSEDEEGFAALGRYLGFPVSIIRIFNLSGPFLNNPKSYALGSILSDIARGGPIVLRADHEVLRSYAFIGDVLNLAMSLLLDSTSIGPFDTAGEHEIEIGALARDAAILLGHPNIAITRPALTGSIDCYVGDGTTYCDLSKQRNIPLMSLSRQILETAAYLAACS